MSKLVEPAVRIFDSIAGRWRLSERESLALLGLKGWGEEVDQDALQRISHLAIFNAINTLLPARERTDGWILAANTAPIDLLNAASVADLKGVRQYLESQIEAPYL